MPPLSWLYSNVLIEKPHRKAQSGRQKKLQGALPRHQEGPVHEARQAYVKLKTKTTGCMTLNQLSAHLANHGIVTKPRRNIETTRNSEG